MNNLYFPLIAVVDYRGYRLVGKFFYFIEENFLKLFLFCLAMTVLPILGNDTLVYGSADAGKTIHQNAEVHKLLEALGNRLNLRDHPVGGGSARMVTPLDLEVHEGFVSELKRKKKHLHLINSIFICRMKNIILLIFQEHYHHNVHQRILRKFYLNIIFKLDITFPIFITSSTLNIFC